MKRFVLLAGLLVLAAVGAALWSVYGSLGGRLRAAIERTGREMALAPVHVAGVDLDLSGGRGTIRGITVGNPEGFPEGTAISLAEITIALGLRSLREFGRASRHRWRARRDAGGAGAPRGRRVDRPHRPRGRRGRGEARAAREGRRDRRKARRAAATGDRSVTGRRRANVRRPFAGLGPP